jgi:formyl-CoA transferase
VTDNEVAGLGHFTVLDLSRTEAGAVAAFTLASLGATVVKVESAEAGSQPARGGARYALFNADKRSLALDLNSAADLQQLLDLVDQADVVIEDWGHGATDQAGLGYTALRERNPALVYGQVTTFNAQSRFASMPVNEGVAQAAGGLASITGDLEQPPLLAGFGFAATAAGLFTALGVLTALYRSDRTGEGQLVAVSMQEAVTSLMRGPWGRGMRDGGRVARSGNGFTDVAPMDVFPCAPGGPNDYVYLWVGERDGAAGWHAMLRLLGRSDLEGDPRFETVTARAAHRPAVDQLIRAWTKDKSKTEVMDLAVRAGVICGAVMTTEDLAGDEELWARRSMLDAVLPDGTRIPMPSHGMSLSDCPSPSGRVAAPGEHNSDPLGRGTLRSRMHRAETGGSGTGGALPLAGVRVVDLTHAESGPFATEMLAVMGAEVIKIERPPDGEYMRHSSAFTVGKTTGTAPAFGLLNANKKSVVIDLKTPANLDALRQLIRDADVFVENFFPGAIDRMGLGYEELRQLNPGLIYAQLSGYPSQTRKERFPSFDMVGQASGGLMAVTGYEGGPPQRVGAHIADSGAGLHLAIAILAALNQRTVTSRGQRVQVSMQESAMNFARVAFALQAEAGHAPARRGNRPDTGVAGAVGMYACAGGGPDDYCYIDASGSADHWEALARAMGAARLIDDARFISARDRSEHRDDLDALIRDWTRTKPKDEVMERLFTAGVPAGSVLSVSDLISRPDYWEQGALDDFVVSGATLPMLHVPIRMSAVTRASYWLAEAGTHNEWFEATVGRVIETAPSAPTGSQPSMRFSTT